MLRDSKKEGFGMFVFFTAVLCFALCTISPLCGMEKESLNQEEQEKIAQWLVDKYVKENNEAILPFVKENIVKLRENDSRKYIVLKRILRAEDKRTIKGSGQVKQIGGLIVKDSLESYIDSSDRKIKIHKWWIETGFCMSVFQTSIAICVLAATLTGILNNC
jgi:hypothetical protein